MSNLGITTLLPYFSVIIVERKENSSLRNNTIVASLDIVIRILEDPRWNKRAKKVRTLEEMRRMILDFCREKGIIVKVDGETCYTYV
jgi:hypothetical protein